MASKSARRRSIGSAGIGSWPNRRSDSEPLAPLGPTTSEHAATALGGHAGHEAMLALTRALLGLIRPLHGCVPFPRSTFAIRPDKHTNGWRSASLRAISVGPFRSGPDSSRGGRARSNGGGALADASAVPHPRLRTGCGPVKIRRSIGTEPLAATDSGEPTAMDRRSSGLMVLIRCPADSAAAIVARPPSRTARNRLRSTSDLGPEDGLIRPLAHPGFGSENLD
jgi:hypothetical protein